MSAHAKECGLKNGESCHETRVSEWTLTPQDKRPKMDAHATRCVACHNRHSSHMQNLKSKKYGSCSYIGKSNTRMGDLL